MLLALGEMIKMYDRGISVDPNFENEYQMLVGYWTGGMWVPQFARAAALAVERFIDSVEQGATPDTDDEADHQLGRLFEAAGCSMAERGAVVRQ